jgi:two-component system, cell cycle response regulator
MRVLIADDNAMSRLTLRSQLKKWGYEVVEASDGDAAWAILSMPDSPRLAILDWMMPGLDGIELCRRVRAQCLEPYVYVILLTGREGRDDVVAGLDAGADDYVTKPFDAQELRVRVRAGERICTLQGELVAARETLRYEATHDHLTGAWNRAAILDTLERERTRAARAGVPISLAMVDFDHFKRINDSYGHQAGDAVLREGLTRVTAALRTKDLVGRYGGEEFLVVMPGCDPSGVNSACERIRASVCAEPIVVGEHSIQVTVSIGAATWSGVRDPSELIERADAALYVAKRKGRDRVELAPDVANDRVSFAELMIVNR